MPGITAVPNQHDAPNFASSSSSIYDDMSVAEIKSRAKESVSKDARGFSAISLIKTARSQFSLAKSHESKTELKSALSAYIKAASLAAMAMESSEYHSEKGKNGVVRKELSEFMEHYYNDMNARVASIEEKLRNLEKQSLEGSEDQPTPMPLPSIQDRLRALQGQGMEISTKRISRDASSMPPSPLAPKRISTSSSTSSTLALLSTLSPPTPISSTSSQHTIVSPSTLGPPSPSSSPSSSPLLENMKNLDIAGFSQSFPSIDELNENPLFSLPSAPTGINGSKRDRFAGEPPPTVPSIRDFVPMERPSSTPIPPVTSSFVSRPASPSKPPVPLKPSNLSSHVVTKTHIPNTNIANPEELYSYLLDHNVLLIDVRDRANFEQEHIRASAIICVEPSVLLRENLTIEMLDDAMVIAPKQEQSLFTNRDKFDLVAVYDQDSTTFKTPINVLLRIINERAFKKMLKKMPMMLVGGLDEWKRKFGESEVVKGESGFPRSPKSPQSPNSTSDSALPGSSPAMQLSISPSQNGLLLNGHARLPSPLVSSPFHPSIDQPQIQSPRSGSHTSLISHPEVDQPQSRSPQSASQPGFSIDQPQARRPPTASTPYMGEHRSIYSVDNVHGHSRSPAESYPSSPQAVDSRNGINRRPATYRPASGSISYTRSTSNGVMGELPITNGISSTPITYPQVPRQISPAASASSLASPNPFSPQLHQNIVSPPQASVKPSNVSRKRSDYIDQSQEALSTLNYNRGVIDYPASQILRPPPAAVSSLERQDKRVQHIPQRPTEPKPPRIDSEYPVTYWSDLQVSTSGLKNLGNTCYMNAPIQCLSATVPFARFFIDGRWKSAINFMNPLGSKGKLAGAFADLVRKMWLGDLPYLSPLEFRKSICQLKSEFIGNDQHDSQEFLTFLLDGIHEDLNRIIAKPPIKHDPEQEATLERMPAQLASEQEWRAWRTRNDSIIVDYFQGQFRSRLQCLKCNATSTTYNVFSILQLPIPARTGKVSIERCLDAFFNEEILEKDNCWDCPKCKAKQRASKKLSLARLPPILVVQLKRFEANGRFSDKIDTFVEYPTKALDLTNYMPPPLPPGADRAQLNGGLPLSLDDPRTQVSPYRYDLYGVTNHYGNLSSGHYTAFIASRDGWLYCDDSSVKQVDPRQVVNQKAYLLFYKRIKA